MKYKRSTIHKVSGRGIKQEKNMQNIVIGNNFNFIQRNFEKEEHLDYFVSGYIRMGLAEAYRLSEDPVRRNPREGRFSGRINYLNGKSGFNSSSCIGFFYILSFSTPYTTNQKKKEYGNFFVKISAVDILFERIKEKIGNDMLSLANHGKVVYKNSLDKSPGTNEFFFEQNKTHESNQEYRFLFLLSQCPRIGFHQAIDASYEMQRCLIDVDIPKYITIKGVKIEDICEVGRI